MPLLKIQSYPGVRQVFIASEDISHLAVVEISSAGPQYVKSGVSGVSGRVAGVLYGAVTSALGSGKVCRVVTQGIVSGVVCASSIEAGDRVTLASGGRIAAFNTITPLIDLLSGTMASGAVGVDGQALVGTSGLISGVTGIRAINTAQVLGKALASGGGAGSGIPILVTLGG
ncbi:hypothetical protein ES703_16047 [subsurface metagenome]